MNEITYEEYLAVEDFANILTAKINNRLKETSDKLSQILYDYFLQLIDINLQLKRLEFEQYTINQQKTLDK